jgi:hypothetical protein
MVDWVAHSKPTCAAIQSDAVFPRFASAFIQHTLRRLRKEKERLKQFYAPGPESNENLLRWQL